MRASVTLRTADGRDHELGHGDLIGRLWSARLQLASPDVSEAHALVSLRGGQLHLLALRGLFALRGRPSKDLVLQVGQRIAFARDVEVTVVDVILPDTTLGLEGQSLLRQPLAGVCSLMTAPRPRLVPGRQQGAAAVFFMVDDRWMVQTDSGIARLTSDWRHGTAEHAVWATEIALRHAGQHPTRAQGKVDRPLRIELHFDSVHVHREGLPTVSLHGHAARVVTELGTTGTSIPWSDLASALWPDLSDRDPLRKRFDSMLARTRRKLRQAGLRTDLISADGAGHFHLLLRPSDQLDDRS